MTYPLFIYVEGRDIYFSLVAVDIKNKLSSKNFKNIFIKTKFKRLTPWSTTFFYCLTTQWPLGEINILVKI